MIKKPSFRKFIAFCITVSGVLTMFFASAFSTILAGLFMTGAGFLISALGTYCALNVVDNKLTQTKEQNEEITETKENIIENKE